MSHSQKHCDSNRPIRFIPAKPLQTTFNHKGIFISQSDNARQVEIQSKNSLCSPATRVTRWKEFGRDDGESHEQSRIRILSGHEDLMEKLALWRWSCCKLPHEMLTCPAHKLEREMERFNKIATGYYFGTFDGREWRVKVGSASEAVWNLFIVTANDSETLDSIQVNGTIPEILSNSFEMRIASIRSVKRLQLSFQDLLTYSLFDTPEMVQKMEHYISDNNSARGPSIRCEVDERGKYIRFSLRGTGIDWKSVFRGVRDDKEPEKRHKVAFSLAERIQQLKDEIQKAKEEKSMERINSPPADDDQWITLKKINTKTGQRIMSSNESYFISDWSNAS
mmetsp:Transcript_8395/g.31083  ORF Transcript_8395/g.31083 Transcript_8395/m.31083 type:complete len:336 (-) Transcript_8395:1136-2143(-)